MEINDKFFEDMQKKLEEHEKARQLQQLMLLQQKANLDALAEKMKYQFDALSKGVRLLDNYFNQYDRTADIRLSESIKNNPKKQYEQMFKDEFKTTIWEIMQNVWSEQTTSDRYRINSDYKHIVNMAISLQLFKQIKEHARADFLYKMEQEHILDKKDLMVFHLRQGNQEDLNQLLEEGVRISLKEWEQRYAFIIDMSNTTESKIPNQDTQYHELVHLQDRADLKKELEKMPEHKSVSKKVKI